MIDGLTDNKEGIHIIGVTKTRWVVKLIILKKLFYRKGLRSFTFDDILISVVRKYDITKRLK